MQKLDKKIRNVWISISVLTGLFIGTLAASITYVATEITALTAAAFIVFPVLLPIYSFYRYKNWYFKVHQDHLEINHGVLRKTSAVVPYVRVQHIDTNRGPLERILRVNSKYRVVFDGNGQILQDSEKDFRSRKRTIKSRA
ncbi:hypothetical protein HRED_02161 [Candidatus Haloredivivus sp. G17]|nr:hypothetical protein HRED_02161 [Candidatus Haloredivivus sp. G17]